MTSERPPDDTQDDESSPNTEPPDADQNWEPSDLGLTGLREGGDPGRIYQRGDEPPDDRDNS